MKLQFTHQPYQQDAVNAVVDLFYGQPQQSRFSAATGATMFDTVSNRLSVREDALAANLREIQRRNRLPYTSGIGNFNFSIEMETGTGKTYVYTQTIYEMNRRYGFTKFIVVVPSIAIREGVKKSLDITHEHFQRLYDHQPIRWFIYNSQHLGNVRDFAESTGIEIMIINIDAFRKSENVINQELDRMNSGRAIDLIRDTNPIVIIDEPQSVDTTPKAKEAIASLNPMLILRYSATHREKINTVYRLTPVDAYQQGLVKQIAVSSIRAMDDYNQPYIRLVSVDATRGFSARVEIDVLGKNAKITRTTKTVKLGANLFLLSGERDLYAGWTITDIDCTPGLEKIELSGTRVLPLGQSIGGIPDIEFKRAQIAKTIELHLDKETRLLPKGIKVLSLFFIDRVERYRHYEDGEAQKGEYARIFEEEYERLISRERYKAIRDILPRAVDVSLAHEGYFSVDKKGRAKNTRGDTTDDRDTYELIMRDKERLLSMDEPLRFIFSHSALKEGWDNPNVFQVCTLLEQSSALTCRQKIGRGLRLCVNTEGERVYDRQINTLHIIASESFAEFARDLQGEIEQETGVRFGILDIASFEDIEVPVEWAKAVGIEITDDMIVPVYAPPQQEKVDLDAVETVEPEVPAPSVPVAPPQPVQVIRLDADGSRKVFDMLQTAGVVDKSGELKRDADEAIKQGTFVLPEAYQPVANPIISRIRKATAQVEIRDESKRVVVRKKKQVFITPEFNEVWDRIKHKTRYRIEMNLDALMQDAVERLKMMAPIQRARIEASTATIDVAKEGVTFLETNARAVNVASPTMSVPNALYLLQDAIGLDLNATLRILRESGRLHDFARNPERFVEQVTDILKELKHSMAMDGIRYRKIDGEDYYLQEIFDKDELIAFLGSNALAVEHSVYDHVIYDSQGVERRFAEALDRDPDVKLFIKLPDKFTIDTPLGNYNPDWAVLVTEGAGEKLYLVIETKGSTREGAWRGDERRKIRFGQRHFEAVGEVDYKVASEWKKVKLDSIRS